MYLAEVCYLNKFSISFYEYKWLDLHMTPFWTENFTFSSIIELLFSIYAYLAKTVFRWRFTKYSHEDKLWYTSRVTYHFRHFDSYWYGHTQKRKRLNRIGIRQKHWWCWFQNFYRLNTSYIVSHYPNALVFAKILDNFIMNSIGVQKII